MFQHIHIVKPHVGRRIIIVQIQQLFLLHNFDLRTQQFRCIARLFNNCRVFYFLCKNYKLIDVTFIVIIK